MQSPILSEEIIKQICNEFLTTLKENNKVIIVPKDVMEIDLTDDKDDNEQLQRAINNIDQINDVDHFIAQSEQFNRHMIEHLSEELRLKNYGIVNMGQTCYLSSVVQVLKLIPEIQDMDSSENELILSELKKIYQKMNEKKEACNLETLLSELASINHIYSDKMMANDADECLKTLLDVLALDSVHHFITEKQSRTELTEELKRQSEESDTQFIFCCLDRVFFDRQSRKLVKHDKPIDFPITFEKYKLIGFISHWGASSITGHNVAYITYVMTNHNGYYMTMMTSHLYAA